MDMEENAITLVSVLPYIVSVVCAIISGCLSYMTARRQAKIDIEKLQKQFDLDIEKEREKFKMEKEKMEIEHSHQLELKQKELDGALNNGLANTLITEVFKMPEIKQQINQEIKKNSQRKH